MPELPEVETIKRGIAPHMTGKTFVDVIIRFPRLRWPIPPTLPDILIGQHVIAVWRRAKYLIIEVPHGAVLLHLGMSGHLRILSDAPSAAKHDHVDFVLNDGSLLRLHDPRRFGAVLWQPGPALLHPLLSQLGPEPLDDTFDATYLHSQLSNKNTPIKLALMDNRIVVGVGNIYANEALFHAGILPQRPAKTLNIAEIRCLVTEIKNTLQAAIHAGGSTLKDFVDSHGKAGYFQQTYYVYQRHEAACHRCGELIQQQVLGGRGTFFCRTCQR